MSGSSTVGPLRRELQLVLILYGGVSVAVWMGAATHEIELLRRASRVGAGTTGDDVGGMAGHDREIPDAGVSLCRRADVSEAHVDVVAGTSAGPLPVLDTTPELLFHAELETPTALADGLFDQSLLADKPLRRHPPWWAALARSPAGLWWKGWVKNIGNRTGRDGRQ